jgi:alanine racemase
MGEHSQDHAERAGTVTEGGLMAQFRFTGCPPRPAWIELDLRRLRSNFSLIHERKRASLKIWTVVKDNAYGHGAVTVALAALASGTTGLAVNTLGEAAQLRAEGINAPILMLGERDQEELPFCIEHGVMVSVGDMAVAACLDQLAQRSGSCVPVHLKVDTGMGRFGLRWDGLDGALRQLRSLPCLVVKGVMSHLAMSDETDKTFAREQTNRFDLAVSAVRAACGSHVQAHLCNSGGFLDLPEAHYDAVRLGILPLGVYPSEVCARMTGLRPVLTLKARVVSLRQLGAGETYGYGMRYRAPGPRRIGVLPIGYGDGYPRLVNCGEVLVRGQRVPIVGSVAMDAMGIDLNSLPAVGIGEEVVLLGEQGTASIPAGQLARWAGTVGYDLLAGLRGRLPRVHREGGSAA